MGKFKVGDKVKVLDKGSSKLENGDIGVITLTEWKSAKVQVNDKSPFVNWVSFKDLRLISTGYEGGVE